MPANLAGNYFDLRPLMDTSIYDRAVQAYYTTDPRVLACIMRWRMPCLPRGLAGTDG